LLAGGPPVELDSAPRGPGPAHAGLSAPLRKPRDVSEVLPVQAILPGLLSTLEREPLVLLEAPPGSGKTTRVPEALLEAHPGSRILVLEPRRVAARWAARFVAARRGQPVGATVGYQVRFDDRTGPATRLVYATEGILIRRFLDDPHLRGVDFLLLDEFHERHLPGDLALALTRRLQARRASLRVLIMSATLGGEKLQAQLGGVPLLRAEGRIHPVQIRFEPRHDARALEARVGEAVSDALARTRGHVLVFLPGAAEIRRAHEACRGATERHGVRLMALHGDLSAEAQDEALRPEGGRKLILSTNLAESSLTVAGVEVVVDSGLARLPRQNPWSGLSSLQVERISRASADQRAGRAGRTGAGECLRLYSQADYLARPEAELPEIARLELAELLLTLHALGLAEPEELPWLEAPPSEALERARILLELLGALQDGSLTGLGRRMAALPAAPRAARLLLECVRRGRMRDGCELAALLSERDLLRGSPLEGRGRGPRGHGESDLLWRQRLLRNKANPAVAGVLRAARQLEEACRRLPREAEPGLPPASPPGSPGRPQPPRSGDDPLLQAILSAFPDRVARVRQGSELLLALGGGARLAEDSAAHGEEWLAALEAEETPGKGRLVRLASPIDPAWLLDYPEFLEERTELQWNPSQGRVESRETLRYGELVLHESRRVAAPGAETGEMLWRAALTLNPEELGSGVLESLKSRVEALDRAMPEAGFRLPEDFGFRELLAGLCRTCTTLREVRERAAAWMSAEVGRALGPERQARLDSLAPTHVSLAGRRRVPVHYPADAPPYVASRMADFFGMRQTPRIAGGRLPLVVHLLAPNQRPVQITSDLAGFWERHWPRIRRELARRYPRHPWPEDPLA